MLESVRIGRLGGLVHAVRLDPPITGTPATEFFGSFDAAAGYATGMAASLRRRMIDETGRLSEVECAALVLGLAIDRIDLALQEV